MLRLPLRATLAIAVAGIGLIPLHELAANDDPAVAQGRALYMEFQCWQCHGYSGQGGPAARIASMDYPFEAFERFVRLPNVMPAYPPGQLDDDSLRQIYAFVQSIPEPPPLDDIPALQLD